MISTRRDLGFITAASMALVLGGSAAVVAQAPNGGAAPDAGSAPAIGAEAPDEQLHRSGDRRGPSFRGRRGSRGERGLPGRGFAGPGRLGIDQRIIRSETIVDGGEQGIVTQRVENGTVAATGEGSLTIELANGESSEVAITDGTMILAVATPADDGFRGRRGLRARIMPGSLDDVAVGASVNVASRSTDGGPFEAHRVVVRPMTDATEAAIDAPDAGATDDAAAVELPADIDVPATA